MTTRAIESFVAEMYLGEGAGGIKCVAARGSGAGRFGRGMGGVDTSLAASIGASWAFDSAKKVRDLDTYSTAKPFNTSSIDLAVEDPCDPAIDELESPGFVHDNFVSDVPILQDTKFMILSG